MGIINAVGNVKKLNGIVASHKEAIMVTAGVS
jgi:hypothetical protein